MNNAIFYFFYSFSHRYPFLDGVIIFLADFFPYIVIVLAAVFLLFHHDVLTSNNPIERFKIKWKEITLVFFSGFLAWIFALLLKELIHSSRPFMFFSEIEALFLVGGYAFPSGHAAFFFAISRSIQFFHKKAGYIFLFFALLISLARISAGVHSPIDILGGFVLGSLIAFICGKILGKK